MSSRRLRFTVHFYADVRASNLIDDHTSSGRIVIAAGGSALQGGRAIYSDDGGVRWTTSGLANPRGGEAQVAVAQNGQSKEGTLPTEILLEDTDGLRRPP